MLTGAYLHQYILVAASVAIPVPAAETPAGVLTVPTGHVSVFMSAARNNNTMPHQLSRDQAAHHESGNVVDEAAPLHARA